MREESDPMIYEMKGWEWHDYEQNLPKTIILLYVDPNIQTYTYEHSSDSDNSSK